MKRLSYSLLILLLTSTVSAQTYYVSTAGNDVNSGASWQQAFRTVQKALSVATRGEIWVARGMYIPSADVNGSANPNDPRTRTFVMKNNLALYGGFAGTEISRGQRNWRTNTTTLSGDIGILNDNSDNSYSIITNNDLNGTAVLDGFTVSDGNSGLLYNGGGMKNDVSSPFISNCIFSGNTAASGGGIYNVASSPELTNCSFLGNKAYLSGGALFNYNSSSPVFTNCVFSRNDGGAHGGGMYNLYYSSPTLINCSLSGNTAGVAGGIFNWSYSSFKLVNCILWGDTPEEITGDGEATIISSSIVQGGCPFGATCSFVLNQDPLFASATDLHLQPCSLGIDAGEDAANTQTSDPDDNPRKIRTLDMGAYEHQGQKTTLYTFYKDKDEDGFGDVNAPVLSCSPIPSNGSIIDNTDCDDGNILYEDKDGDGFGSSVKVACGVANNLDCNDADKAVHPQGFVCPPAAVFCNNTTGSYAIAPLDISKDCGVSGVSYVVKNSVGVTTRSGNTANASGPFAMGLNTITWTVSYADGSTATCSTNITINTGLSVTIADVKVLSNGVSANTVYTGYAPAASITLTAQASGSGLTYLWSTGAKTKFVTVSPTNASTYKVTVTNSSGCVATAEKRIAVVSAGCGGSKVSVCHGGGTLCVDKGAVANHLKHGDMLGKCGVLSTTTNSSRLAEESEVSTVGLRAYPNPTNGEFTIQLTSAKAEKAQVLILDGKGVVVEQRSVQWTAGLQTLQFNLSGKASGLYLVQVWSESRVQFTKVAVRR